MKILIACSDIVMLGLLKEALSGLGTLIHTAPSEEIITDHNNDYDVIITLFSTPFLSGKELMMKIRKKNRPKAQICMVSWTQHEQTVISLYENGINQYFTLPINLNKLTNKIKENILQLHS